MTGLMLAGMVGSSGAGVVLGARRLSSCLRFGRLLFFASDLRAFLLGALTPGERDREDPPSGDRERAPDRPGPGPGPTTGAHRAGDRPSCRPISDRRGAHPNAP